MKTLGANDTEAGVRVSQHQYRIRLDSHHQFVTLSYDVSHCLAQIRADSVHIHLWIRKFQVLEEHAVERVIIVLPGMRQDRVEICPALVDHGRQPDNLRARPHDDEKLEFAVVIEGNLRVVHIYSTGSK